MWQLHLIKESISYDDSNPLVRQIRSLLNNSENIYFSDIEQLRKILCRNRKKITFQDYGKGSRFSIQKKRIKNIKIKTLCRRISTPKKWGIFLYNLIKKYDKKYALELGTGLGFASAYILKALKENKGSLITVEGDKNISDIAKRNLEKLKFDNFQVVNSTFDNFLKKMTDSQYFDFVYFDGNHQYYATVKYFLRLEKNLEPNSIVVFDDINWSKQMYYAWQTIAQKARFCINLFDSGVCIV